MFPKFSGRYSITKFRTRNMDVQAVVDTSTENPTYFCSVQCLRNPIIFEYFSHTQKQRRRSKISSREIFKKEVKLSKENVIRMHCTNN